MPKRRKKLYFDADRFSSLKQFYDEVENVLTKGLDWKIGRNLDAFEDLLRGGFGTFKYGEPIELIWKHSEKSKKDLGWPATVRYLEAKLKTCHPTNRQAVKKDLVLAKSGKGETLFEILLDILRSQKHVKLTLL